MSAANAAAAAAREKAAASQDATSASSGPADVPIVPGIMPMIGVRNLRAAMRLSPGSETPPELERALAAAEGDDDRSLEIGVDWATDQCRELLAQGAPGVHFYTLNKSSATLSVHAALGL